MCGDSDFIIDLGFFHLTIESQAVRNRFDGYQADLRVEGLIFAQGDAAFRHQLTKPLIFLLSELTDQMLDLRSKFLLRSV